MYMYKKGTIDAEKTEALTRHCTTVSYIAIKLQRIDYHSRFSHVGNSTRLLDRNRDALRGYLAALVDTGTINGDQEGSILDLMVKADQAYSLYQADYWRPEVAKIMPCKVE